MRLAWLGAALTLVMGLALVVPAYAAGPMTSMQAHSRLTRPLQPGMVLTISGSGTAFDINDQTQHQTATIQLTVTVERASFGRALLKVNSGSLTVGSTTYTVDHGRGIVNFHSGRLLLKVMVKNASGVTFHLVLYGKAAGDIPTTFNTGTSFNVNFLKPQSKLAAHSFLEFNGATVTRTS